MAAGGRGGRLPSRQASAGLLDVSGAATDSLGESTAWRSIALEGELIEARHDELERLRAEVAELQAEVAELRAARARLIRAADADCHRIERDLHEGAQQYLVALPGGRRQAIVVPLTPEGHGRRTPLASNVTNFCRFVQTLRGAWDAAE